MPYSGDVWIPKQKRQFGFPQKALRIREAREYIRGTGSTRCPESRKDLPAKSSKRFVPFIVLLSQERIRYQSPASIGNRGPVTIFALEEQPSHCRSKCGFIDPLSC